MPVARDLPRLRGDPSIVEQCVDAFADSFEETEVHHTGPWREWATEVFGLRNFAPHQAEMWDWAWNVELGKPQRPFVGIWPRDHGKSTTVQAIVASLAARRAVQYVVYVSETQEQADRHVGDIESNLTTPAMKQRQPELAKPQLNEHGHSRGWRRDRLTTASGLVVDGLGLDVKARGMKFDNERPDLIILDDIDSGDDSKHVTDSKEYKITDKILQAGTPDTKVLAVQNLVKEDGIFYRIWNGDADYLLNAYISYVVAIENFEYERRETDDGYEYEITGGTPTWSEMGIPEWERVINRVGPTSFLKECQHEVEDTGGGMFDHLDYRRMSLTEAVERTDFVRTVVAVDPAISDADESDCHGIQVDALGEDGCLYRLFSWEQRATSEAALRKALLKGVEYNAEKIIIETDQGGDTWRSVYERAWNQLVERDEYPQINKNTRRPRYAFEKASSTQKSKSARANEMLQDYEAGNIVHVTGTHLVLERGLNRAFVTKPFDLADASYWSWRDLRTKGGGNAYVIN